MKLKYLFAVLFTFAACSQDEPAALDPVVLEEDEVMLSLPEFQMEEGGNSRTIVDIQPNKVKYSWKAGDLVGIFPDAGGDQVYFSIQPDAQNTSNATAVFDGGGWALKRGFNYIAYYPFQPEFKLDKDNMQVSFKEQQQEGRTTDHLSGFDYMVAAGAAPQQGNLHFQFHHLVALGIANVTLPEPGKVNRLTFQFPNAEDRHFHETASYSISDGEKATLKPLTTSNSFKIEANNLNVTDTNEEIVMPFMQGPMANVKGKACFATINYTSNGKLSTENSIFSFAHDWAAGKAYNLKIDFKNLKVDKNKNSFFINQPGLLKAEYVPLIISSNNFLCIKGNLNGSDFSVLRQFAQEGATPVLHYLDITAANIKTGGTPATKANVIDKKMFAGCTALKELDLPSFVNIEVGAFNDLKALTMLLLPKAPKNIDESPFIGFTNSENCDLLLDDYSNSKKYVSLVNGKLMFGGVAWKSITTTSADEYIPVALPDSDIAPWEEGEGGDLDAE